jgi:hypothetical protein
MQVDRRVGGVRYVNAGSVGMPYEGVPSAYWVLLGPDVEHRRTPYDIAAATAAIEASGMPEAAAFAADYVAVSRSREETATLFESRAAE